MHTALTQVNTCKPPVVGLHLAVCTRGGICMYYGEGVMSEQIEQCRDKREKDHLRDMEWTWIYRFQTARSKAELLTWPEYMEHFRTEGH